MAASEYAVPDAVVTLVFEYCFSPAKAWRTYLRLRQADVALRMDISQSAYSKLEASKKLRKSSREKIASAMGISAEQLDF